MDEALVEVEPQRKGDIPTLGTVYCTSKLFIFTLREAGKDGTPGTDASRSNLSGRFAAVCTHNPKPSSIKPAAISDLVSRNFLLIQEGVKVVA